MLIWKIPWFNWRDAILYSKDVQSGGHKRTVREDKRPQGKTKRPQKTTKMKCPPLARQNPVKGGHRRTRPFIQFQCVARALQRPDRTNHPYCTTTVTPTILCILWASTIPYKAKTTRFGWFKWSKWRDSNPRPFGPEPNALPSCATPRWNRDWSR